MAVSFKVPKSPSRSIFNIDNFLGVDLTNTGANIYDVRSPNAENMIRYVPGKVRKRMGYENYIQFGTPTNVNRALNTSYKEQRFDLNEWIPGSTNIHTTLYELTKTFPTGTIFYVEFDYKSEYRWWCGNLGTWIPASDEYTHYSGSYTAAGDTHKITGLGDNNGVPIQALFIKNFSMMTDKDANYKYKKAPVYFVERATNDPIYGCHIAKSGTFEGNRVKNVNRALNTSDTFTTFSVTSSWQQIYTLGESVLNGVKIYIEVDYKLTGDPVLFWAGGATFGRVTASSTTAHFSANAVSGQTANTVQIKSDGTSTLDIQNLSIMYEVDSTTYDWSAAPEDNGGTFPVEDIYLISTRNYAISESFDDGTASSGGSLNKQFTICDANSHVNGMTHVSFDLHTSTYGTLNSVEVWMVTNNANGIRLETSTENYNSKHFDWYYYFGSGEYVDRIGVVYSVSGYTCWTYISNIQVNAVSPRASYDISPKWYIYHVGTDLYLRASNSNDFTKVYSNANRHLSKSWQFNKRLYILDGKDIYSYGIGDETIEPIGVSNGYIPTLTIAKSPNGGGISYEPLNMLQPGFYELFSSGASSTSFQLSFGQLDSTTVKVWVMNSSGGWDEKIEGTDFKVNRGAGEVIFTTSPGSPPLAGEDNVKILAYRTVPGYRERITKCTNGTLFGVGGAEDRLFLTGNPDYPNWDFYSEQYDPSYFPDTGYSALGSEASAIVGYALVNNYLAAFKDGGDLTQAAFIREGDLIVEEREYGNTKLQVSNPAFKLINTLQGHGVIAPYAFGMLQTEPVFLTKSGIFAITAQDITGEKYSQNRSFYLDGKLKQENNLEDAVATVYNDMYILAVNNQLYVLDGLQATRTDRSEPYATRQYVGFHCSNVPAICLWNDEALFFGTNEGKICRFHTDVESLDSYNDDGDPIYCCWETPDLDGKLFYKNKTFRYFAIRMMKALRTSVKMYTQKLGTWTPEPVKEDTASGVVFDFENIDFELFSFSTDRSEKVVHTKIRVKKADKARFKLVNENMDEPFGLFDLALEYIESGNYKG